jgi:voltage-gated potassium channel Kch
MNTGYKRNSIYSMVKHFFTVYQFPLLWLSVTGTAILGATGFVLYFQINRIPFDFFFILYSTLQLFTLEANLDIAARVPFELTIARVLAPTLLGITAWKTFAILFADQLRMLSLPLLRNHVIICGLGERGYHLARSCRLNQKNRRNVVIIERDSENDYITTIKRLGAIVITGNAAEPSILRSAGILRADIVFALTYDDGANHAIALQVEHVLMAHSTSRKEPLHYHAAVSDLVFFELTRMRRMNISNLLEVKILRLNLMSARLLFDKHPLDGNGIAPQSNQTVHLVVAGFGNMGQSVVLQAVRIGQFANGKKMRITLFDKDASRKAGLFMQMVEGISQCAEFTCVDIDIESVSFVDRIKEFSQIPDTLLQAVFCINDQSVALRTAFRIQMAFKGQKIGLYVRLESFEKSGTFLIESAGLSQYPVIYPFGILAEVCSLVAIENKTQDTLARIIHESYLRERQVEGMADESCIPWKNLDSDRKDSNRQQADHIPVKMRAINCIIAAPNELQRNCRVTEFTHNEVEALARMEHTRWNVERFIAGWKYGVTKDPANRMSPYLVGYDRIDNSIQEYDRQAVCNIPIYLEQVGLWVYRRESSVEGF